MASGADDRPDQNAFSSSTSASQYAQLIARRVREQNVYCEIVRHDLSAERIRELRRRGSSCPAGRPASTSRARRSCDPEIFELGVPVLGICYGMQLACEMLGGEVKPAKAREFGRAPAASRRRPATCSPACPTQTDVWMSHGDQVQSCATASSRWRRRATCPHRRGQAHETLPFYGVQFHPEVTHTPRGEPILQNFLYQHLRLPAATWRIGDFLERSESPRIREQVGDSRVICGLSGGVDSSVVAALLHKAIGEQLACIFVDNGLLRKGRGESVEATFRPFPHRPARRRRQRRVPRRPQGRHRPAGEAADHRPRVHRVLQARSGQRSRTREFLAQGTLYPDVIESGAADAGTAAKIKLHHNVGGLPAELGFELVEPLRELFKDEVRRLGARARPARGDRLAASLSPARAWRCAARRSHARAARRSCATPTRSCSKRLERAGPVSQDGAGLRGAAAGADAWA